jgi:hypothetical protein
MSPTATSFHHIDPSRRASIAARFHAKLIDEVAGVWQAPR